MEVNAWVYLVFLLQYVVMTNEIWAQVDGWVFKCIKFTSLYLLVHDPQNGFLHIGKGSRLENDLHLPLFSLIVEVFTEVNQELPRNTFGKKF